MDADRRASLRAWAEKMGGPWSGNDQAADAVLELLEDYEKLRAAVDEFLDFEDDHREGPVISDSYVTGPICADENCMRYWPCPVEELRRAAT